MSEPWIGTDEFLPKVGERVLIAIHGRSMGVGHKTRTIGLWTGTEWLRASVEKSVGVQSWPIGGDVTHWMKLPKPPGDDHV